MAKAPRSIPNLIQWINVRSFENRIVAVLNPSFRPCLNLLLRLRVSMYRFPVGDSARGREGVAGVRVWKRNGLEDLAPLSAIGSVERCGGGIWTCRLFPGGGGEALNEPFVPWCTECRSRPIVRVLPLSLLPCRKIVWGKGVVLLPLLVDDPTPNNAQLMRLNRVDARSRSGLLVVFVSSL